jgi:hypothetical protein
MRRVALMFIVFMFALTGMTISDHTAQPVVIHVDDDAAPGGNGTARFPFDNLPDAVDAARTILGRVIIQVEPGDYPLTTQLVIDRSLELRGSTVQINDADFLPTGEVVSGTATRIFASNATLPGLLLVDRGDSTVLHDVNIRGFVIEGTAAGISILLNRVQGYWIADNVFRAPATFGMQSVASSGRVSGNYFSGVGNWGDFQWRLCWFTFERGIPGQSRRAQHSWRSVVSWR